MIDLRPQITLSGQGKIPPLKLIELFEDGVRNRLPKMLASDLHELLINNIDSNKYGFVLSAMWSARKKALGFDSRPFIAEGHYKREIRIMTKEGHYTVGFHKTKTHPRTHKRFSEIAVNLEYGQPDKGLPPRPLWRNTVKEHIKTLPRKVQAQLKKDIGNGVR